MSNYTGKIDLGNVVLTGQSTAGSAETSINVTIPDYTEQPFTIVFNTNDAVGSCQLNLGAQNTNDYAYRVRLLKKVGHETTVVSDWSNELRTAYSVPQVDYNIIQIIGNGPSSYALWRRNQNSGLTTSNLQYSVAGNINSLFNADISKTRATEESALISSYMNNFDEFSGIQYMFSGDTRITDAYYLYLPYVDIPERGYNELFGNASNLIRGPYRVGPLSMQDGQGSVGSNGCADMFFNCSNMVKGPKELRFRTLSNNAYSYMFNGCVNLMTAPELPATTLSAECYKGMFFQCMSLTVAPELPASTMTSGCYQSMFAYCTSLTTAPELNSDDLYDDCYHSMFEGCTSLRTAPKLPATNLGWVAGCYHSMFKSCTSLTTAPELPAMDLAAYSYQGMFAYCTSLTTAPKLPAKNMQYHVYDSMFQDCTSLTTAPELPATTLVDGCYSYMFQGCTSLTTAPYLPAETLADHCYDGMFQDCSNLNWIAAMFKSCENGKGVISWVDGVADTGTFVANSLSDDSVTGATEVRYGAPLGWDIDFAVPIGGVAWRTRNIGAEEVGNIGQYFAWGDESGYTSSQVTGSTTPHKDFTWTDYKYGSESPFSKYDRDGKTVIEPVDDAARVNLGGLWRMPTKEDFQSLGSVVTTAWSEDLGMEITVTANTSDYGKKLSFPPNGVCEGGENKGVGSYGRYWSSSRMSENVSGAHLLGFNDSYVDWGAYGNRFVGNSVRPVIS